MSLSTTRLSVRLTRHGAPGEDPGADPHERYADLPDGARLSDLLLWLRSSDYLPGPPGGGGPAWVLVDERQRWAVAVLDGQDTPFLHDDRALRAPYRFHLTAHPDADAVQLRQQASWGVWDGPGRRPPRVPGSVRAMLTRASVHPGDDADAPHHRTVDLPAGSTDLDIAAWVLGHYGASVTGGSVWVLAVEEEPVAVITRSDDGSRPHERPGSPPLTDPVLVDSVLMVGRRRRALPDEVSAHLTYRRREHPFTLLQRARDAALG